MTRVILLLTNTILITYTIMYGDEQARILAVLLMPLVLIGYLNWRNRNE